jgi:hypothetical protein
MTDMLRIYKEKGDTRQDFAYLMPGTADCYGEPAQDLSRLLMFGCHEDDLGGEARLVDRQVFVSAPDQFEITEDFMDGTQLLRTIAYCGQERFELNKDAEGEGFLVVEHIPGHFN